MRGFQIFAAMMLFLAGCGDGTAHWASGHQVGFDRSNQIADFGEVRVELADVVVARRLSIPETRYFSFAWSPQGHARIYREKGWRSPSDTDWQNFLRYWHGYVDRKPHANPAKAKTRWTRFIDDMRQSHETSGYQARVRSDGVILVELCRARINDRHWCQLDLRLEAAQKRKLAQMALARFEPGCQIERIDPPEVTSLRPNYRSGALSLIATIVCN